MRARAVARIPLSCLLPLCKAQFFIFVQVAGGCLRLEYNREYLYKSSAWCKSAVCFLFVAGFMIHKWLQIVIKCVQYISVPVIFPDMALRGGKIFCFCRFYFSY